MPAKNKPATRVPEPEIKLPAHMTLTPMELAATARLVRVYRTNSWLKYYIEWLLHMDAVSGNDVTVKQAEDALGQVSNFVKFVDHFENMAKTQEIFREYPGLSWLPLQGNDDNWLAEDNARVAGASLSREEQLSGRTPRNQKASCRHETPTDTRT
jgi:hypothetical protein